MKRLICALLCVMLALTALPAFASEVSEVMAVTGCNDYVSLREKPDTSSKRLKKVHLGELVTDCAEAENGFVRCEWDGKTGYILAKYLTKTDFTSSDCVLVNQQVVKCEEYVSLREKPDTSSKRLVKVPLGAIVTRCVSYMGNFVYCEYKGKTGYILTKYLTDADYTVKVTATPTAKPTPTPTPKVYPALPDIMQVVNCAEWVSLRKSPSASSAQLEKVPLGETVDSCRQVSDDYVYCRYNGKYGYINVNYLAEPAVTGTAFDALGDFPAYSAFIAAGEEVLTYSHNGYTVAVRRAYGSNSEKEELLAVCYNSAMLPLWSVGRSTDYVTELDLTDAFIAGTAQDPVLVLFKAGEGFTAYDIGPWTDVKWECADEEAKALAGITKAVDDDGTMYITGYYSSKLLRVSPEGQLIYAEANPNTDLYWPYIITIDGDYLTVVYDSCHMPENYVYAATYGKDGTFYTYTACPAANFENPKSDLGIGD